MAFLEDSTLKCLILNVGSKLKRIELREDYVEEFQNNSLKATYSISGFIRIQVN